MILPLISCSLGIVSQNEAAAGRDRIGRCYVSMKRESIFREPGSRYMLINLWFAFQQYERSCMLIEQQGAHDEHILC